MINIQDLRLLFSMYKEQDLCGRYIHNEHILPLINRLKNKLKIEKIGESVQKKPIYSIKMGKGSKRILMWSQMHGNESTTTKAVFDLINTLLNDSNSTTEAIFESCTICIIPILNPDGAEAYTRFNANKVDLNRDAQKLSQPESRLLRDLFDQFKPNYCYNLHGQRTIFSAGKTNKPATISFLAPAQDKSCTITETRKKAMELVLTMNNILQKQIKGQVAIYDDSFNINCVGDQFQSLGAPTILFEAGHYKNDYVRERTRELIFYSLLTSLDHIANNDITGEQYFDYLKLPANNKLFYDIILRNTSFNNSNVDIAIQFEEILLEGNIQFVPRMKEKGDLSQYFGHKEIDVENRRITIVNKGFEKGVEIVIVNKNQENKVLNLKEF